jgi:hypothetical protein
MVTGMHERVFRFELSKQIQDLIHLSEEYTKKLLLRRGTIRAFNKSITAIPKEF